MFQKDNWLPKTHSFQYFGNKKVQENWGLCSMGGKAGWVSLRMNVTLKRIPQPGYSPRDFFGISLGLGVAER